MDTRVLVNVNFREYHLLFETEGVVAAAVHVFSYTVEVTDTGDSDSDEFLKELVHLDIAESHLGADRHSFTELEVRNVLSGLSYNGFLTCKERKFGSSLL